MLRKIFYILFLLFFLFSNYLYTNQENKEISLNEQYIAALKLIGQEKYDAALSRLKDIIKRDFTFSRAYSKIVEISKYKNDLDSAKNYFDKLIQENKENPGTYYGLGLYYKEKKDLNKAVECFMKAIKLFSRSPHFYAAFINSSKESNQLDAAENLIKTILHNESTNTAAHYGMGFLYHSRREWDESMKFLDEAIKLDPNLLVAYRLKCDLYIAMNKYKELLELASDKVKLCENRDTDLQIDFLTRISKAYSVLGQYGKALEVDEKALDLAREIGNKKSEGALLGNIGVFYANTGELQKGLDYFYKKLAIVREIKDREGESHILMNIGAINDWMGNYKNSLKFYKQALEINREFDNPENKGLILGNIGAAYEKLSEYTKALHHHHQALEIFQKIKNKRYEAWVFMNIGALIYKLGRREEAIENLKKALRIVQEVGEKASEGMILGFIGSIYSEADESSNSLEYLTKALEISREIGDRRTETMHLGNLGSAYIELEEYEKAAEVLDQGVKLAEQVGDTLTGTELLVISGILYRESKDHRKSIECFQKTLLKGNELINPRIMWNSEWGLALTYEEMNNYNEAVKRYQNAIDIIESIRGNLETEEQKVGFLRDKIKIYEGLIKLLFKLAEKDKDLTKRYVQESFNTAERAKSRVFLELLAEAKFDPTTGLSAKLESEEKNLQRQLTNIQQRLLNPKIKEAEREKLYQELQSIESKYNDFILKLRKKSPKYASLVYPEPYTLDKVQKELLNEKTFIIEFFIGEENSFVWIISRDKILWSKSFPSKSEFFEKIATYQNQISQRRIKFDFSLGKEIFDVLLKDALEQVPVSSHLIIIPDGLLLRFPFEALVKEIKKSTPKYLLEDFTITYAPSASVLGEIKMLQREEIRERIDLLALGNPIIKEEGKVENAAIEYIRASGVHLSPLPFAENEVLSISEVYKGRGKKTEVYVKEEALEEVVKSKKAGQYKILHFATHGLIDDRVPALSGLLLAPSKEPEGDDGFLRLNEIFNLNLNADLITLSACETALGKEVRGEGMIGLTRAFFYAGARSIVASLWMVSDQSTSKLMEDFYQNLVQGKKSSEALQLAKLKLLKSDDVFYNHPFFWAPFVFMGID